jgi:hypothetical protein
MLGQLQQLQRRHLPAGAAWTEQRSRRPEGTGGGRSGEKILLSTAATREPLRDRRAPPLAAAHRRWSCPRSPVSGTEQRGEAQLLPQSREGGSCAGKEVVNSAISADRGSGGRDRRRRWRRGGGRCREAGKRVEKQDRRVKKKFCSSTRERS